MCWCFSVCLFIQIVCVCVSILFFCSSVFFFLFYSLLFVIFLFLLYSFFISSLLFSSLFSLSFFLLSFFALFFLSFVPLLFPFIKQAERLGISNPLLLRELSTNFIQADRIQVAEDLVRKAVAVEISQSMVCCLLLGYVYVLIYLLLFLI